MEVIAAMAIMGLLMMALGNGFSQSFHTNTHSRNYVNAMDDAKKIIEQIRYVAETSGLSGSDSVTDANYWSNNSNSGWLQTASFSDLPSASRTIEFPSGTSGDPIQVKVNVQWNEGRGSVKRYVLETLVTKRGE